MTSKYFTMALAGIVGLTMLISPRPARTFQLDEMVIYDDGLAPGWDNWSWDTTVDFAAPDVIHGGTAAIAITFDAAWAGFYLHANSGIAPTYKTLRFWIWGNGQTIGVYLYDQDSNYVEVTQINPPANAWTQVEVPLNALMQPVWGISWAEATGTAQTRFFLDDIALMGSGEVSAVQIQLEVDAGANQHPISPYIYGMNFADPDLAADIRLPVNRWGGNATTRYNWQNDTSNRASDWYFENIPNDNANPDALPNGSSADQFITQNIANGTATLLTIPLIGWTPSNRDKVCGFSVTKYGPQQDTDPYMPDCGNGMLADGSPYMGNDPTDTSTAIGPEFVQAWQNHLVEQFGSGVQFYNLDNEPSLWNSTHRDVHPEPLSYDELRDRTYAYAAAIKQIDPNALTLGPVEWGWPAYFYSALDIASDPAWWNNPVDRNAHGGVPLVAWYLEQMRLYEEQHGVRILDYLDLHFYPQADGVSLQPAGDAGTQALRLRSTRALWDATYVDESWIGESVMLIPRMKGWIAENYPGTRIAITEYNFGGLEDINGALTQADVLGIFGREGVDLAALWGPPTADEPGAYAFRIYRNYDGAGSGFGETSVQATSSDQGQLVIYAAQRSDGALTVVVINKTNAAISSPLNIHGFTGTTAEVYRYSGERLDQIVHDADLTLTDGAVTAEFPANSITLLVVRG